MTSKSKEREKEEGKKEKEKGERRKKGGKGKRKKEKGKGKREKGKRKKEKGNGKPLWNGKQTGDRISVSPSFFRINPMWTDWCSVKSMSTFLRGYQGKV